MLISYWHKLSQNLFGQILRALPLPVLTEWLLVYCLVTTMEQLWLSFSISGKIFAESCIRRPQYFFHNSPKPTRYLQDLSYAWVTEWNFIPYTDFFSVGCFQQVLMPLAPRTHKFQYTEQIPSCWAIVRLQLPLFSRWEYSLLYFVLGHTADSSMLSHPVTWRHFRSFICPGLEDKQILNIWHAGTLACLSVTTIHSGEMQLFCKQVVLGIWR